MAIWLLRLITRPANQDLILGDLTETFKYKADKEGTELFNAAKALAQSNGVTGSPTVVINGVKANVARTADGIKTAVCSAYNEAPAECDTVLDSSSVAAAGNC